jgi:hypothetical protein
VINGENMEIYRIIDLELDNAWDFEKMEICFNGLANLVKDNNLDLENLNLTNFLLHSVPQFNETYINSIIPYLKKEIANGRTSLLRKYAFKIENRFIDDYFNFNYNKTPRKEDKFFIGRSQLEDEVNFFEKLVKMDIPLSELCKTCSTTRRQRFDNANQSEIIQAVILTCKQLKVLYNEIKDDETIIFYNF